MLLNQLGRKLCKKRRNKLGFFSDFMNSRTSFAWPIGFTFSKILIIFLFLSKIKVVLLIPKYSLPMNFFLP